MTGWTQSKQRESTRDPSGQDDGTREITRRAKGSVCGGLASFWSGQLLAYANCVWVRGLYGFLPFHLFDSIRVSRFFRGFLWLLGRGNYGKPFFFLLIFSLLSSPHVSSTRAWARNRSVCMYARCCFIPTRDWIPVALIGNTDLERG